MFLSAAHEFGSVQFRTVRIDAGTDLHDAIASGPGSQPKSRWKPRIVTGQPSLSKELLHRQFSTTHPRMELNREDVVVFSGGAYGITPFVAQTLVRSGARWFFWEAHDRSRSGFGEGYPPRGLRRPSARLLMQDVRQSLTRRWPGRSRSESPRGGDTAHLERPRSSGIEAEYLSLRRDRPKRTASVLADIQKRLRPSRRSCTRGRES